MRSLLPQRHLLLVFDKDTKSIALSSCEAEFISAVSGLADGIYVKRMLETVIGLQMRLELRIDSSSARALLQRQGLQRTRHISTGLLWVQQKVAGGEAFVKPIPGKENSWTTWTSSMFCSAGHDGVQSTGL